MKSKRSASGETVPNLLITLDNFDAVRDADFDEEFSKLITQIAREGAGRGIIKLDDTALFQASLPADGEEALAVIDGIQETAREMDEHWSGERPEEIPMMPEGAIEFAKFRENKQTKNIVKQGLLPVGFEFEEVTPLAYDPAKFNFLTVVSDKKDGVDKLTHAVAKSMTLIHDSYQTMIIDTNDQPLSESGEQMNGYISEPEGIQKIKAELITEIDSRKKGEADQTDQLVMIKDMKDFVSRGNVEDDEIPILLEDGPSVGIHFIICGDYGYIGSSYDRAPKYVRRQSTVGLLTMRLGDQDIFNQPFIRREKYPEPYECYYAMDHEHVKIKIPE